MFWTYVLHSAGPKKLSAYNQFMKTELGKVKAANPKLDHKEAFKAAAANWKHSSQNPKKVAK